MNRISRHCLRAALLLMGGVFVTTGQSQFVEDSLDCGATGVGSLCYNQRAGVIYGASEYGPFFAISADSNKIVSSTLFDYPVWVAYDSTDNKAYCIVRTADYDTIMVMSGTTHQRIGCIPLEWGTRAVWNPDNDRLYVTMDEMNMVAVIDCRADTIITKIPVGSGAVGAVLNRRHQKLYVQNWDSDNVSIIDLNTNQVVKTVAVGNSPEAACYSTVADKYYCGGNREILAIDGRFDSVVHRVAVADLPVSMVESPAHGVMMVGVADSMLTLDVGRDTVLYRMRIGMQANGMVWSSATDQIYCAVSGGRVAVFPGGGERVALAVPVGSYSYPFTVSLAPEHGRLYVGCLNTRYVYVIRDTASGIQEQPPFGPSAAVLRACPNPFTTRTAISLQLTASSRADVRIFDAGGRLVRLLRQSPIVNRQSSIVQWDGRDGSAAEVPAGVYTVVRAAEGRTVTVTLVKAR